MLLISMAKSLEMARHHSSNRYTEEGFQKKGYGQINDRKFSIVIFFALSRNFFHVMFTTFLDVFLN